MKERTLVVRLGAMGDILHALPAVESLKRSGAWIAWAVEERWMPLLDRNPFVDKVVPVDRRRLMDTIRRLREQRCEKAVDFQGLIKSSMVAMASGAESIYGFDRGAAREGIAALFYTSRMMPQSTHVVDRNLELAAFAGATELVRSFWIPTGQPEGDLPETRFVLANPLAGWRGKQWPIEHFVELGGMLRAAGFDLVLNLAKPQDTSGLTSHVSGLAGLIDATRRAVAVVGLDSGPLHLAAALGKPGVAIFGPTDPARNGPYGGSMTVLRAPSAITTYKRSQQIDAFMHSVTPAQVWAALRPQLPN